MILVIVDSILVKVVMVHIEVFTIFFVKPDEENLQLIIVHFILAFFALIVSL
jgi:hypothetical protein